MSVLCTPQMSPRSDSLNLLCLVHMVHLAQNGKHGLDGLGKHGIHCKHGIYGKHGVSNVLAPTKPFRPDWALPVPCPQPLSVLTWPHVKGAAYMQAEVSTTETSLFMLLRKPILKHSSDAYPSCNI